MKPDKQNPEEIINYIRETYSGCRLRDVSLYVGNYQFPFENKQGWHLCDVALELQFGDETFFTFAFDPEWEVLDYFGISYSAMVPDTRTKVFKQSKHSLWAPFIGNTLEDIRISWNWYEDFDGNRYYIPQLMEFLFVDGKQFTVAAVMVGLEKEELVLSLDSEGEILVGFSAEIQQILSSQAVF